MQPFKRGCRFAAKPGMYSRGLQDRAPLCGKPAKPGCSIQPADGATCFASPNDLGKSAKMSFELFDVQVRGKGTQPAGVERIDQLQIFLFGTIQHYPDIQE